MRVVKHPSADQWAELLKRPQLDTKPLQEKVAGMLHDIEKRGDAAVREYTRQFDQVDIDGLLVTEEEFAEAKKLVPEPLQKAIAQAKQNIQLFHEAQQQKPEVVETMPGVRCWRKMVAIEKVGLYIPGGTAPLFSTILMLGIPAQIAGCQEVVLCTPPQKDGKVNPVILFTAQLLGIKTLFKIGGVQAIGAMAFGTESVPKVYKIFGPGNQYVTAAKQYVSQLETAIDMPAGPSEVAVMADDSCHPEFIAADLLSQAEHGIDSQVLLATTDAGIVEPVQQAVKQLLERLPRKEMTAKALDNSLIVVVKDEQELIDLINAYAPEHLIIATGNYQEQAERIINAGSVFLGHYTPESAGDYASGTNHTLPTHGFARTYSGVSLDSFVKKITFQEISEQGIRNLGPTVEKMAEAELLEAHKLAVTLRLNAVDGK